MAGSNVVMMTDFGQAATGSSVHSDGPGSTAGAVEPAVLAGLRDAPQRLYRASAARLSTWLDCPRRYRMAYLDRPRPVPRPQRAHTTVGIVVHGVLRDFWDLPSALRTPQEVARLVERAWADTGFRDSAQSERWRRRVLRQVVAYLGDIERDRQPLGVERPVAFRSPCCAFNGRVDRLDEVDGGLVVVDYKTGRRAPDSDEPRCSLALGLYAHAVQAMFRRPCRAVELHHVPTRSVVRFEPDARWLTNKLAEAESVAADLRRVDAVFAERGPDPAVFPVRVSALCRWCDLREHCPEGRQAGPEHSSWAGLDGEDD